MEVPVGLFVKLRKVAVKLVTGGSDGTGLTARITGGSDGTGLTVQD